MLLALIGLILALVILYVVYWAVTQIMAHVTGLPSIVPTAIKVVFVLIAVWMLVQFAERVVGAASFSFLPLH